VSNTGPGLTPEEAAHVFERFWRADAARQRDDGGSGLGLAIAHQLVQLHGGRIWVESGAEQTTFVFTLPSAQPEGNVGF
jgi:signal transduction histidine kinase